MYHNVMLSVVISALSAAPPNASACVGEFSVCPSTGACTLIDCSRCTAGEYRCPRSKDCVNGAAKYADCPGLDGTHLDWRLGDAARLDYLVAHTAREEQAAQLVNQAPAIAHLGIPAYNWLNDDVHALASGVGTVFPNGNTLGASWSAPLLGEVGGAIGHEARAAHSGFTSAGNRGVGGGPWSGNGVGLHMYGPNVNLVRDPWWGRAQEVYSEDPALTSALAASFVSGAQQHAAPAAKGDARLLAGACCKHLAAYDVEDDRFVFDAAVSTRDMFEFYLPQFRACAEAGVNSMMASYNSINGVSSIARF